MKNAITRFDDTLHAALNSGLPDLANLADCIQRILQGSTPAARDQVKRSLGEDLSLGYHRVDSLAIQQHRHLVRAALLAQIVLRVPNQYKQNGNALVGMGTGAVQTHIQNIFNHTNKAHPVINGDGLCSYAMNDVGRGGIKHELQYASSSGNIKHLCYIPTREMVWVRSIRIGVNNYNNIAPYGDGANFNRILYAPWYPTTISATDSPASPHPNLSTLDHTIVDKHSHTTNMATGPMVGIAPINDPMFMFQTPLVDSALVQEQWYQYNDTADPTTWNRQNVANDANIDPHWTNIPGGNFTLIRELYRGINGVWMLKFTKKHGLTVIGQCEVVVLDHNADPAQ